jgi:hypothetical protein
MTVGELSDRITSAELTEWMAYFSLEQNPPKPTQTASEARAVLSAMASRRKK